MCALKIALSGCNAFAWVKPAFKDMPGIGDSLPLQSAGGMLATWMRIKYPHILDGAIAGSAPIWSYLGEVRLTCTPEYHLLHALAGLQGTGAVVLVFEHCVSLPTH